MDILTSPSGLGGFEGVPVHDNGVNPKSNGAEAISESESDPKVDEVKVPLKPKTIASFTVEIVCVSFLIGFIVNYFTDSRRKGRFSIRILVCWGLVMGKIHHSPSRVIIKTSLNLVCMSEFIQDFPLCHKVGHVYLKTLVLLQELAQMKETAQLKKLPPVYTGKWATASDAEIQAELEKGTPHTYRFRVPKHETLKIQDLIRGEVSWGLDTLGDFVIMRSNGQPVYNFCVTVDDATMAISHVIRAEEHLPNTLRQALIYKALGFPMPNFAHVSLILAPDMSKLSKRHGATSCGQFKEMGYLPQSMVNYLALLGWGDGTEDEFFTLQQLIKKFSIKRINKSGAIFDPAKLRWMNSLHLKALPSEELLKIMGERWKSAGILTKSEGIFVEEASQLLKDGMELVTDSEKALSNLLSYPLYPTLASPEGKPILEDKLSEVASYMLASYDNGEFFLAPALIIAELKLKTDEQQFLFLRKSFKD
ncbi:glutamate--tRNA ligase [Ranunculus cassubicifolius]